jgi:hypothetical protein
MITVNLIGANSFIAKQLASKLSDKYAVIQYSHSDGNALEKYTRNSNNNSIDIYFSIIKDDLAGSLSHLQSYISISKSSGSKFYFISSVNALYPNSSLYSKIKYESESIVKFHSQYILRLGLVISDPPMGAFKSLRNIATLPISISFSNSVRLVTTDVDSILNFNYLENTNKEISLYNNDYSLNIFISNLRLTKPLFAINISFFIYIIKKIHHRIQLTGILGRLLTLTAVKNS